MLEISSVLRGKEYERKDFSKIVIEKEFEKSIINQHFLYMNLKDIWKKL